MSVTVSCRHCGEHYELAPSQVRFWPTCPLCSLLGNHLKELLSDPAADEESTFWGIGSEFVASWIEDRKQKKAVEI